MQAPEREGTATPERGRGLQLYTKILIGLALGSTIAVICKTLLTGAGALLPVFTDQTALLEFGTAWVQPIGDLFIRAIILTVVPLVFTSITVGVHSLGDLRTLGRLGGRTLFVFLGTSFLAACLGTAAYMLFEPGTAVSAETRDLLAQQFADQAGKSTEQAGAATQRFSGSPLQIVVDLVPSNIMLAMTDNRDLLKVILFALLFGISLTLIPPERAKPVAAMLEGINEAMTKLIELLMRLAPYGVFALVFMVVARFGVEVLIALAYYTGVVVLALLAHLLLVLSPLLKLVARFSPIEFFRRTREVLITAFSTSSSSATLPTTMRVAEQQLGVPRSISSFVLPLGATINMDGTTIYQIIAVHFVAQVWGIPIDWSASVTLILTAMLMAIGAAGVPGGVLPLLYVVMATVGIPEAIIPLGIALILGVDRILDMCRSALNVIGDSATAVVITRLEAQDRRGQAPHPPA